ncbi:hypothetical protein BDZ94DRAFT_112051 [Collybia nuda]|uniref:Cytochrome c oxidase assembly protein COX19 n=1 Tax=Collybia nuda TaxID=64659 RepID=A0A9P5XX06_9AGAR|nr:hypothetical protein BDZ94DRAFT_112051 [Collybia nuda]
MDFLPRSERESAVRPASSEQTIAQSHPSRKPYENLVMSFGRPPSISVGFKPAAPDRGSFPLDHYGECKDKMTLYMRCLRENSSTSSPCRDLSRDYLDCRMQKGLMEKDEWKNLGLDGVDKKNATSPPPDVPPNR